MDTENEPVQEETTEVALREEPEEQAQETTAQPSRRERKQKEWGELQKAAAERDDLVAKLEEERRERQRMDVQLAELRGRTDAIQESQRPATTTADRVRDLRSKATNTLKVLNETKDQATAERLLGEYYDTLDQIQDVRSEEREGRLRQEIGQSIPDATLAAQRSTVENEFPWLASNAAARTAAMGYEQVLLSQGKPPTMATTREACAMAARDHKLGGDPAPSNASRQRFALPSGRDNGAGGGSNGRTIPMNDALKKLAEARYPHLEAADAHTKWATETGQKVMAKSQR